MLEQNSLRQSWYEMTAIAGTRMAPTQVGGTLEGPVQLIDFDVALDRLISESPRILAARAKLQADQIIQRIEFELQRQLAMVYQSYLTAVQNVRSYQEVIVPEAKLAYESLLDAYEEDRVDWPQVLESQLKYYQLRSHYTQH